MMPNLIEGKMEFLFPAGWEATKYDEWSHFKNQASKICGGSRAVDFLCLDLDRACWLIEVKDYRQYRRTKVIELPEEFAAKVRDTLAALVGAQHQANDEIERAFARKAVRSTAIHLVLHLEQPKEHSKLFPQAINLASVQQRLKQLLKPIDPHPKVVGSSTAFQLPWKIHS